MSEKGYWIGFDLGGTKMLAAAYDENYSQLSREKKRTKALEGAEVVVERVLDTIRKVKSSCGREETELVGIGMAVPGTIDLETGVVLEAPNLGWENVPLRTILEEEFGCPVVLGNDVDCGVYGEYADGSARGACNVVGIFPGTGVGGGCVIDGMLLQGKRRTAMEIGHIPLYSGGPLDGAFREGTLETVASRLAISAASAQAVFRGAAPNLKNEVGTDLADIRSGILADSIRQGDKTVEKIVQHAVGYIGKAVVTLVHLFSPDRVVLGGGLVEAMPELFVEGTRRHAEKGVLKSFRGTYEIVAAELGDDAAIVGAAAWARKKAEQ